MSGVDTSIEVGTHATNGQRGGLASDLKNGRRLGRRTTHIESGPSFRGLNAAAGVPSMTSAVAGLPVNLTDKPAAAPPPH